MRKNNKKKLAFKWRSLTLEEEKKGTGWNQQQQRQIFFFIEKRIKRSAVNQRSDSDERQQP